MFITPDKSIVILVEVQSGKCDVNHRHKLKDYVRAYKKYKPEKQIMGIMISNEMDNLTKELLNDDGLYYRVIPTTDITDILCKDLEFSEVVDNNVVSLSTSGSNKVCSKCGEEYKSKVCDCDLLAELDAMI